jgi:hypothetical protein
MALPIAGLGLSVALALQLGRVLSVALFRPFAARRRDETREAIMT